MNRPRKKKESSLLHELRELELLGDGEFVDIPELENEDLLEENSMSIIVRCLNPTVHKVGGLVKALPPIWGMEDSVKGRGVGENRVQFFFQNERDLHFVLSKGPWFVNGWIVSLDKWSPNPGPDFLCKIPFWIRIRGLPVHLLKKQAVESLVGPLGFVEKVELHAKNSASVEYVRALVWINTEEPLQFRRIARFRSGEIVPTELEYEKLIKVCFNCKRLTHDQLYCPMQEGLTVDYRSAPGNEKQPTRSEAMEGPNRQRKEESRQRSGAGRGARRGRSSIPEQAPRRTASQSRSRDSGRKDKRVVEDSVQVWRPKKVTTVSPKEVGRSRSTEESSAPLKHRSISQTQPGTGASSGASQDSPSVFNRLGGQNEISPLSRHLSGKQREADDSTPSVFERLSGLESSAPLERNLKAVEPSGNKRRRLSRSDERSSKKAKVVAAQEEATPTVFERLGSGGKGSGSRSSGDKHHSASVAAANAANRSVQRIVLGSGKIVEEGRRYIEGVLMKIGFHDLRTVEPKGKSGGLAVMWKHTCKIEVCQANRRLMDLKVSWKDKSFFMTGVYGDPVKGRRSAVWERLTRIGVFRKDPWFVTGDFNEIIDQSEKRGGAERSEEEGAEFRQMLSNCGLWEIQHRGYKLSWCGVRNNELVQCRLDRSASARYLQKGCSDHSPVINFLDGIEWRSRAIFRYDQRWIRRDGFQDTVRRSWNSGPVGQMGLMQKVAQCRRDISSWKKTAKPNSAVRIQEIYHRLDEASKRSLYVPGEISQLRKELNEDAGLGSRPSYAWRSIHSAQHLIQQGARMLLGSGEQTLVFQDSWIGQKPARRAIVMRWRGDSRQLRPPQNLRVSDLLINDGREWNTHLLARLFPEAELREMVKIRTCGKGSRDVYIWDYNKTGHYSVKSGYWVITNILNPEKTREEDQPSLDRLYQLAWKTHTSPKIHHFLWRCINNAVPVASNLARRRISKDTGCFRCGNDTETINHVLFQCPFARLVWAHSSIPAPPGVASRHSTLVAMEIMEEQKRNAL
ncbi:hypothetical protein Bca52824_002064 [Brassica carinata]|uniref:Reverse transcriptase zinc-binding domain-containing protein n=1 Tax=Brassica carinata TaxID=52824 RepID=A0A8X7WHF9_BRACI|nr:hypothetical protein Bca52824_002064 [Brassica carinata]